MNAPITERPPRPSRKTKKAREYWDFVRKTAEQVREQEERQGWKFDRVTVSEVEVNEDE